MDPIYLIIVIILLGLAALDLVVGVANDAVNFLNSSIGSKVAPLWLILTVASVGVVVGALFSSGMMEIARSGVFHPEKLTFPAVMMLFLAVMITDVVLLDLFNTFGLPTSTTVSLVFELLGAAVAVSLFTIWTSENGGHLGEYINSGKALAIISGIFISIAVAFVVGTIIMYFSRLIFSFNYSKTFLYLGAIWGGIALTAITYFAIFKGLKGSVLMSDNFLYFLENHMGKAILYAFAGWTVLMGFLQFVFRVKILKVIVLAGTMALALAFAGNDLVNFIGVFMAGLDSFKIAKEVVAAGGSVDSLYMSALSNPVAANWQWLLGAGTIMVLSLWFSKKSRSVTETEVNLARKGEGVERFSSSAMSRSIVRGAVNMSKTFNKVTPVPIKNFIDRRFAHVELENQASFDLIRASVNLTISALLISLGTSLKLPLSTTYVTFMVAMGTSLADRAWGRESAVYRINGVLTVVAGWLLTALIAFTAALSVGLLLMWGGKIAIAGLMLLLVFFLFKSGKLHTKRKEKEQSQLQVLSSEEQMVLTSKKDVHDLLSKTLSILEQTIQSMRDENRKVSKNIMYESNELYQKYKDKRNYEVVPTLETIQISALDLEQEYVQLIDYSYEITKSLKAISESVYMHIDNNHSAFSKEQTEDLKTIYKVLSDGYTKFKKMADSGNYSDYNIVYEMRDSIFTLNSKMTKRQIKRAKESESNTRSSILFLNLVNESKIITLQSSNLMKSYRHFDEEYSKTSLELGPQEMVKSAARII
ncbi:MAG: inorganic phosphate transporter [Porphyromonadaceae bacterium]|nr:inorganic phosphate transporter [Porphyromonadaceae bacterium]